MRIDCQTKDQKLKYSKTCYKSRDIDLRLREVENTRSTIRVKNRLSCIFMMRMIEILNSDATKLRIAPTLNASCCPTSDFIPCASTGGCATPPDHGITTPEGGGGGIQPPYRRASDSFLAPISCDVFPAIYIKGCQMFSESKIKVLFYVK